MLAATGKNRGCDGYRVGWMFCGNVTKCRCTMLPTTLRFRGLVEFISRYGPGNTTDIAFESELHW